MKFKTLLLALLCSIELSAQQFHFALPPYDSTEQTFLPKFVNRPIGDADFVVAGDDGSFKLHGNTIKFWSANLSYDGYCPPKLLSPQIAARMRKMGFNMMRIIHLDFEKKTKNLFYQTETTRTFNTEVLDNLDYMIANLKRNGIYIDIILHALRAFRPGDGIPEADSCGDWDFYKWRAATFFDPQIISLHKEFARNLLTHVNPYTGTALASDPVLSLLEITNENTLIAQWMDDMLKPVVEGGQMFSRHSREMDSLWIEFLLAKYKTTEALKTAWVVSKTLPANILQNGDFEDSQIAPWSVVLQGSSKATASISQNNAMAGKQCVQLEVSNYDGLNWHAQLAQNNIQLTNDSVYVCSFWMKAENDVSVHTIVQNASSPWNCLSYNEFMVSNSWKKYEYTFRAAKVGQTNTLAFMLTANGVLWIDSVRLSPVYKKELPSNQSLEKRNIKRVSYATKYLYAPSVIADQVEFYLTLQRNYHRMMRSYLKDTLGVKASIVGSNWFSSPEDLCTEQDMDYTDQHSYGADLIFPSIPWSETDWYIPSRSVLKDTAATTLVRAFGGYQYQNKPSSLSEYNHLYPNQNTSEMLPLISTYAAFHGTDALQFFDYCQTSDWEKENLTNYFELSRNNVFMSGCPLFAAAFRKGMIQEDPQPLRVAYSKTDLLTFSLRCDDGQFDNRLPYPKKTVLTHKIIVSSLNSDSSIYQQKLPKPEQRVFEPSTKEFCLNQNGLFTINTAGLQSISGQLNEFDNIKLNNISLIHANRYAGISWITLDSSSLQQSKHSLLVVNASQVNTGMNIKTFDNGTITVNDKWGSAPVLQNAVICDLTLQLDAKAIRIYRLDSLGKEMITNSAVYKPTQFGSFNIHIDQTIDHTLWYGIETYSSDTLLSKTEVLSEQILLYPSPTTDYVTLSCSMCENKGAIIEISNSMGQILVYETAQIDIPLWSKQFSMIDFDKGVYHCKIMIGNEVLVRPIVKL